MLIRGKIFCTALFLFSSPMPISAFQAAPPKPDEKAAQKPTQPEVKAPQKQDEKAPQKPAQPEEKAPPKEPPSNSTDGSLIIAGQKVEYKATAGMLPGKDMTGKAKANIFYMAYTRKTGESPSSRRITFCFNGGPGSASAYVHLGFFGPRRVLISDDGLSAPRPAQIVENESSLLDITDLVFIDPVSTGLSRAEKSSEAVLFHGLEEDTYSVGEFIRDYLAKFERKQSPVYVAGESYGTTRAASLSSYLQGKSGVKLAGIVLISTVLDFQTISFGPGNEIPYSLFLPTYTATAFHHGKLDKKWATDLPTALKASQKFADGPYLEALHQGNMLGDYERQAVAKQLALLTGLSEEFVLRSDLRIEATRFRNEILRDKQEIVGRYDSMVTGKVGGGGGRPMGVPGTAPTTPAAGAGASASSGASTTTPPVANGAPGTPNSPAGGGQRAGGGNRGGFSGGDPSATLLSGVFTEAIRDYVPKDLGFKTDTTYTLSGSVQPWNYGRMGTNRYANVSPRLRSALEKDKSFRVFVASGYCDLATPYAGTNYTFAHLGPRSLMDQVTMKYYDAGHMIYTHEPERRKLRDDIVSFMKIKLPEAPKEQP